MLPPSRSGSRCTLVRERCGWNGVGGARSGSWWRNGAGAGGGAGCVDGDEPTRWGIRRVTGAVLDEAVRGRLERHRSVSYNWHRVPPMIGWYGMT